MAKIDINKLAMMITEDPDVFLENELDGFERRRNPYDFERRRKPSNAPDPSRIKPVEIYNYAKDVIGNRWPDAEKYLVISPQYCYLYARDVVKKRFPEGENAILRIPMLILAYVEHVYKGRWEAAESHMLNDRHVLDRYLRYIGMTEQEMIRTNRELGQRLGRNDDDTLSEGYSMSNTDPGQVAGNPKDRIQRARQAVHEYAIKIRQAERKGDRQAVEHYRNELRNILDDLKYDWQNDPIASELID